MAKAPSEIEKQNLEAHVELCAIRYSALETTFINLEHRLDKLESLIIEIKTSLETKETASNKQTISIFTSFMGVLIAGLLGFISHGIFK